MSKQRKTSSQRRCILLKSLDIDVFVMRPCSRCARFEKSCKIASDFDKCLECIRLNYFCDLTSFDANRYRRLEEQRRRLKTNLRETNAKQQ